MIDYNLLYTNKLLRGYLNQANNSDTIILIAHGIGGSKTGKAYLFANFTKYLEQFNIASYRFDFLGCADSDGDVDDIYVSNQVGQLQYVIDHFAENFTNVIVLGMSLGAYSLLHTDTSKILGTIHWSCSYDMYDEMIKRNFEHYESYLDIDSIAVNTDFFDDFENFSLANNQNLTFQQNCSTIIGTKDVDVNSNVTKSFAEKHNIAYYDIVGADHLFNTLKYRDKLYSTTKLIIDKYLKKTSE